MRLQSCWLWGARREVGCFDVRDQAAGRQDCLNAADNLRRRLSGTMYLRCGLFGMGYPVFSLHAFRYLIERFR